MSPTLIIDMRCLQDRNYAERGIGNHARCIVQHAPGPFIGVVDPQLPPLPDRLAALALALSPHGYIPNLGPGTILLNPSPMSPNQNFIARLLLDPTITKAACVHDFIPYDDPATYLMHPINRLDYGASMAWLKRYDVFLPVSEDTAYRLRAIYGTVAACVTGVALPPWMVGIVPETPRHILMVGGDDARKNPEVLARAHAASDVLRQVPLVISGTCTDETAARLRGITDVMLPGRLADEDMRALYAGALCVVVPSHAEGFSLPVIEAMAARTPVVVSDIPAHRALVADAGLRFAPDDVVGLVRILEALVGNSSRRDEVIAAQSQGCEGFTPRAVAAKIWNALLPASPAVLRKRKPRLAMLTPLPPVKSGIADYAAALVPELARRAGLTVFSSVNVSPLTHMSGKFDAVVSMIGNAPLHAEIYDCALRWGSAVICHDARLLGLATGRGLEHAANMAGAELDREVTTAEITRWAQDENLREASFLGELAAAARPLIFHSQQPVALMQAKFGVTARYLPFAVQREFGLVTAASKRAAREALGLPETGKIIVSFGFISANKGTEAALRAFTKLCEAGDYWLVFVGEAVGDIGVFLDMATALGISRRVIFGQKFVGEEDYRQYFTAADCGLQLRAGGGGNISGTLQDCIAAGLKTVTNQDLAENLAAPGYVKRVSDNLNAAEIALAVQEILEGDSNIEAERSEYCDIHSMANYAESLLETLGV